MLPKKLGVLCLQGSFAEHLQCCVDLGLETVEVRDIESLQSVSHLIIPGGESTTMLKLLKAYGMWEVLEGRMKEARDLKIFGTCAGAILCSYLGLDVEVNRNGFGAQQASMIVALESEKFKNLQGTFIRAPRFTNCGKNVETLATLNGEAVLIEQDNFLAASFHPELLDETRVHAYFFNQS